MDDWISVKELATNSGVSSVDLAGFITKNFDYGEDENASGFEERICVETRQGVDILNAYNSVDQKEAVQKTKQKWAKAEIMDVVEKMPHTSTPSFEGYRITRYAGFITGTSTINTVSGIFSTNTEQVESTVNHARIMAIQNLKQRAFDLDCNAIVGLDVDFVNVDSHAALGSNVDSHYIVVCANGTAVEIEPIED